MHSRLRNGLRRGFTLVELTVVILIIGVVATIAAPRFFDSVGSAKDKASAQTLEVLRDAIELYRANNSAYPGQDDNQATLKTDIKPFLRKDFPTCQVGNKNSDVVFSTADPLVVVAGTASWVYNKTTGEVRINSAGYISY